MDSVLSSLAAAEARPLKESQALLVQNAQWQLSVPLLLRDWADGVTYMLAYNVESGQTHFLTTVGAVLVEQLSAGMQSTSELLGAVQAVCEDPDSIDLDILLDEALRQLTSLGLVRTRPL